MNYTTRLRDMREDNDLLQKDIAKIIHVQQRTYSGYEVGTRRIPLETLIELAKFYNVDMNYICGVSDEPKPFPKNKSNNRIH